MVIITIVKSSIVAETSDGLKFKFVLRDLDILRLRQKASEEKLGEIAST